MLVVAVAAATDGAAELSRDLLAGPTATAVLERRCGGPIVAEVDRTAHKEPSAEQRKRLGVTYPEIYEIQARAIFEAAIAVAEKSGAAPVPEVMIPLVGTRRELELMKAVVDKAAQAVFAEKGRTIDYLVGTMIELPRAALMAGEIAEVGAFFSFGTNDLTQTTLGVSRDDASRFLTTYVEKGIYAKDPFVSLDVEGVGELIAIAAERGTLVKPDLKLGICGEHGGDPASVAFCESVGLDYVSASPYRVPIARLAAAQASLRAKA